MRPSFRGTPAAATCGAALAIGACALFEGPGDYPPRDGGPSSASDGGSADGQASNALIGVPCAKVDAFFCDDFDHDAQAWLTNTSTGTPPPSLVTDVAASAPASLRSTLTPTPSASKTSALGYKLDSLALLKKGTLSFDFRVDQVGTLQAFVAYVTMASSTTVTQDPRYILQVLVRGTTLWIAEDWQQTNAAERSASQPCGTVTPGEWNHLSFSFDLDAKTESLSISGGAPCVQHLSYSTPLASTYFPTLFIGIPFADAQDAGTWSFHHDDVVFDPR